MKHVLMIAAAMITFAGNKAYSEGNLYSGNSLYASCKEIATGFVRDDSTLSRGICAGTIHTLYVIQDRLAFCVPQSATIHQGVKIVVKHMEDNPEDLHLDLVTLAEVALVLAWPCKT